MELTRIIINENNEQQIIFLKEVDGERTVVFEVRLNPTDIGKVIGKSGRTITAIRTLLTSAAAKNGKRAMLEIIEPEGGRRSPPGGSSSSGGGDAPAA